MAENDTKYDQFKTALQRLEERYSQYLANKDKALEFVVDSLKESCVLRFRVCHSFALKDLKRYMTEQMAIFNAPDAPNKMFKEAAAGGAIEDAELWIDFNRHFVASSRNISAAEEREIFEIIPDFIKEARDLYETMTSEI